MNVSMPLRKYGNSLEGKAKFRMKQMQNAQWISSPCPPSVNLHKHVSIGGWTKMAVEIGGGESQESYTSQQISTNLNSSPFFPLNLIVTLRQRSEHVERCLWFSEEKRARVNRKKSFIVLLILRMEKKAADHQISIQFEFVYSVVMIYNGILIEFRRCKTCQPVLDGKGFSLWRFMWKDEKSEWIKMNWNMQ